MKVRIPKIFYYDNNKPQAKHVFEIMITFGGGMGGGHRYYYGSIKDDGDNFILETLEGETVYIFKNHIVTMRPVKAYVIESNSGDEAIAIIVRMFDEIEIDEDADMVRSYEIDKKIPGVQNAITIKY